MVKGKKSISCKLDAIPASEKLLARTAPRLIFWVGELSVENVFSLPFNGEKGDVIPYTEGKEK
jgi:hypothetical protein